MSSRLLASLIVIILLAAFASEATLPLSEVEALKEIGKSLGKNDWNFNVDPCNGESGWAKHPDLDSSQNAVKCGNCTSDNTTCHVVTIVLKALNLSGVLPRELVKLPHLLEFDISKNYVNGTIPLEWSSLPRIMHIVLEFNQLSGPLPQELGNLTRLQKLSLTSNYFSGELPGTLAKLTTLKDFRIGDNLFTGSIPNFVQNWIHLQNLYIQASGLDGPIPSGIAVLKNMTELRISDLNGTKVSTFPPLSNMRYLRTLMLTSCNIIGSLPEYLGTMNNLTILDLSFNKLSGEIPSNFVNPSASISIYLTGNLLNGSVPDWMLRGLNLKVYY